MLKWLTVVAVCLFGSVALAAATAQSRPSPLSEEKLGKLLALVDKDGLEGPVDKIITHALGLTADSEVLTLRQYGQMESPKLHHYFNRLQGDRRPGGSAFLLMRLNTVGARVYLLRPDLTLVAAVSRKTNQAPVPLSASEARKDVLGELRFWSRFVDRA